MRVRSFAVQGYRSLADVRLDHLGQLNVFYGENGSGKSNILQALALAVRATAALTRPILGLFPGSLETSSTLGLTTNDFYNGGSLIQLSFEVEGVGRPVFRLGAWSCSAVAISLILRRVASPMVEMQFESIRLFRPAETPGSEDFMELPRLIGEGPEASWTQALTGTWVEGAPSYLSFYTNFRQMLQEAIGERLFRIVPAIRTFDTSVSATTPAADTERRMVDALLSQDRLAQAMFHANTSANPSLRQAFTQLRELLTGPPLHRPWFDPVQDRQTNTYELQEVREVDGEPHGFPLAREGLGLQNVYIVLSFLILGRTFTAGIEEPEAHLHAPTTGRQLRELLLRSVERGFVHQLFVATHASTFALDATGYFDVRLSEDRTTVVERRSDLVDLDRRHLDEPGAARRALLDSLRDIGDLEPDRPVLYRADGTPIGAQEMIRLLTEHDADALEFLQAVTSAAVRAVILRAKKPADP